MWPCTPWWGWCWPCWPWRYTARRQLETAGDVVSVSWVRPVFKYGVAFCAAVALGETLYSLFSALLPRGVWGLLLMLLLWGAAGYFVAEMLLRKKFWVFRGSWKGCVVLLCCLTAAMCLMEFDVTGFERPGARPGPGAVRVPGRGLHRPL